MQYGKLTMVLNTGDIISYYALRSGKNFAFHIRFMRRHDGRVSEADKDVVITPKELKDIERVKRKNEKICAILNKYL